ncbi:hypothetical protein N9N67_05755 [Bacteriovoracaceae bacterium]|nr:hypothetical protein [Bacteriovoracaceae bacterium]
MIVIDNNHRLKKMFFEEESLKNITFQYVTSEDFLKLSFLSTVIIIDANCLSTDQIFIDQLLKNEALLVFGNIEELKSISSKSFLPAETLYIDVDTSNVTLQSIFRGINYLVEKQENYRNQLVDFDQKISGIVDVFEEHLIQIKKIYDRVVFFRKESVKNIQLFSKYCAGRSPGGDYFDAFSENSKFYLYCTTTNSYLLSNLLMKLFLDLKTFVKKDVDLEFYLKNLDLQVRDTFKNDKKITFDFCLTEVNLNNLTLTYYRTNSFGLELSGNNLIEGEEETSLLPMTKVYKNTLTLKHGERLLVYSPGFKRLWSKYCEENEFLDIFNNQRIYPKDIVDELAFQLRSKNTGYFLDTDSSTIILEVDKNAVLEV